MENVPHGKPVIMYNHPELYGTRNYKCHAREELIDAVLQAGICTRKSRYPCDRNLFVLCQTLIVEFGLGIPESAEEAAVLYVQLRHIILDLIE